MFGSVKAKIQDKALMFGSVKAKIQDKALTLGRVKAKIQDKMPWPLFLLFCSPTLIVCNDSVKLVPNVMFLCKVGGVCSAEPVAIDFL